MIYCQICLEPIRLQKITKPSTTKGEIFYYHPVCFYKKEYETITIKHKNLLKSYEEKTKALQRQRALNKKQGKLLQDHQKKLSEWRSAYGKVTIKKIKSL